MLTVISPAKTLDYETPVPAVRVTQPRHLEDSRKLVDVLRRLTPAEVSQLMKVSPAIAGLTAARFASWRLPLDPERARPALFAFMGDVYAGLQARSFDTATLARAQERLRILSGLYGVLRPLDLMLPYRLEMGTALSTAAGDTLYEFWGTRLAEDLRRELGEQGHGDRALVNLASVEYFRAVDRAALDARVVSPVFRDEKNGVFKVISFYAKKARGMMAAWILRNDVRKVDSLRDFDVAGYRFSARDSDADTPVFNRRERDLPPK